MIDNKDASIPTLLEFGANSMAETLASDKLYIFNDPLLLQQLCLYLWSPKLISN
jgi:hypothetical protein